MPCTTNPASTDFAEVDEYINSLENTDGALIPVLHKAQELYGYLPKDVQLHIAARLQVPSAKVYGVSTFYSLFSMEKRGKNMINVCMGTACYVRGAEELLDGFARELNIQSGETTPDGLFTVDSVRCVGACGLAPVVMVNDKVYGRVRSADIAGIIQEYRGADNEK